MEGHEERAAEAEYELSEMEDRSDKLADDVEQAKADWQQAKQDDSIPGARGEAGDEAQGEDDDTAGEG